MKTDSTETKKLFIFAFFILLSAYLAAINFLTPKMVEEFPRTIHFISFLDFIKKAVSAIIHSYLSINGRLFSFIMQYSLLPFVSVLNILNAIIFCFFIYGLFLIACLRRPNSYYDLSTLIFIFCLLWFFVREFAEATLWKVATTTYLWPLTGTLYFIYPFLLLFLKKNDIIGLSRFKLLLLTLSALFLSTGHELLSIAICIFLIIVNLNCLRLYKKIPLWCILSTISYFIGTIALIIAPGNYVRAHLNPPTHTYSFFEKIPHLTHLIYTHVGKVSESLPLLLILALVFFIMVIEKVVTQSVRDIKPLVLFLLLSSISAYATIGIPGALWYGDRVAFFSDTFLIIAIIATLSQHSQLRYWNTFYILTSLIALCFLVPSMILNYKNTQYINAQMEKRIELLKFYKKNNNPNVILPLLFEIFKPKYIQHNHLSTVVLYTPHLVYKDISDTNPQHWVNKGFVAYYNFPQAVITIRPQVELWSNLAPQIISSNLKGNFHIFVFNEKLYFISLGNTCESLGHSNPLLIKFYPNQIPGLPKNQTKSDYTSLSLTVNSNNVVTVINTDGKIKNDICAIAVPVSKYQIKA